MWKNPSSSVQETICRAKDWTQLANYKGNALFAVLFLQNLGISNLYRPESANF